MAVFFGRESCSKCDNKSLIKNMKLFKRHNSDLEIVENIKLWKKSIEELYNKYFDKTYNFVYFKVKDRELAEDLVSEWWFKIMRKIDKFNPEKEHQVSVWIFTIIRNNMFDYFKKNKKVINNSEEILEFLEADSEDLNKKIDNKYFRKVIISEMENLSKQEKEIINLKYFSDLKNNEISKILKIKEKSVSSAISKWLQKLENIFKNDDKYKLMFQ